MAASHFLSCVCLSAAMFALQVRSAGADLSSFTRLVPTHPTVIAAATAFPGGGYNAENILKPPAPNGHRGGLRLARPGSENVHRLRPGPAQRVAAFRHIQRRTPDTIAEASLLFSDTADFQNVLATVKIQHVDEPGGDDLRRVRTGHGPGLRALASDLGLAGPVAERGRPRHRVLRGRPGIDSARGHRHRRPHSANRRASGRRPGPAAEGHTRISLCGNSQGRGRGRRPGTAAVGINVSDSSTRCCIRSPPPLPNERWMSLSRSMASGLRRRAVPLPPTRKLTV